MKPPVIRLRERHPREVRLPAHEAAFLRTHARHLIEVAPGRRPGTYELLAREYVGWFDGPTRRYEIAPKLPGSSIRLLLGGPARTDAAGERRVGLAGWLDAWALELADGLREISSGGLVAGYAERETAGPFLRGRLCTAQLMRHAATRAVPDRWPVTESSFEIDVPWNRIPRTVGEQLLSHPGLGAEARAALDAALAPLRSLPADPVSDDDFAAAEAEPRVAHYRPLLDLCRRLHDGLTAAAPAGGPIGSGFLIHLARAFERYLVRGLTGAAAARPGWDVATGIRFAAGPVELIPDVILRYRGRPRVLLDAKWKSAAAGPEPADVHQVLAYAAVSGAERVVLAYPGRRPRLRRFLSSGRGPELFVMRVAVAGPAEECERGLNRCIRVLCRQPPS